MDEQFDVAQFNGIVANRRSIYPYQFERGKRVDDAVIWQILENANRAPTHKLTQPWRFTVFTGEGLQKFAGMQTEIYTKYAGAQFREKKLKNLREYPLMSSHVVVIGMKRSVGILIPEEEELIATACAVENIYLSVCAYGLGGYLSTGGITYLPEARAYFGLGSQDRLVGIFYIGCVGEVANPMSKRGPVTEKTIWIKED